MDRVKLLSIEDWPIKKLNLTITIYLYYLSFVEKKRMDK